MSQYYSGKTSNIFQPGSLAPFRISRTKIDLFTRCPRCFYLDQRLGVKRPDTYPLTLNIAVDELLKKEFDIHRAKQKPHPFMETYGIDAVPFQHPKMDEWRDAMRRGVEYLHEPTNLSVRGGVDDIWKNSNGELHVIDYKATSRKDIDDISLDGDLGAQYQKQMEIYQWILRRQQDNFKVSDIAYFVYVNGKKDVAAFDSKLEFDVKIIPYKGDDSWVEGILFEIKKCLDSDNLPQGLTDKCDYCLYRKAVQDALEPFGGKK